MESLVPRTVRGAGNSGQPMSSLGFWSDIRSLATDETSTPQEWMPKSHLVVEATSQWVRTACHNSTFQNVETIALDALGMATRDHCKVCSRRNDA